MSHIADRGEFIDVLRSLCRNNVLIVVGDVIGVERAVIDSNIVYRSHLPLIKFGLVHMYENPDGFPHTTYYRLSPKGRAFADQMLSTWQARPLHERLFIRLVG